MSKAKMGRIYRRANTERIFGSADYYNIVRVENEDGGDEEVLFFTDDELVEARERAAKNDEDGIKPGILRDLFD